MVQSHMSMGLPDYLIEQLAKRLERIKKPKSETEKEGKEAK